MVPSRYYVWRHTAAAEAGGTSEPAWETEMLAAFDHYKRHYGTRRGEYEDNALPGTTQTESRWSRLKTEEMEACDWPVFADLADAQANVADYFDYHNQDLRRSRYWLFEALSISPTIT